MGSGRGRVFALSALCTLLALQSATARADATTGTKAPPARWRLVDDDFVVPNLPGSPMPAAYDVTHTSQGFTVFDDTVKAYGNYVFRVDASAAGYVADVAVAVAELNAITGGGNSLSSTLLHLSPGQIASPSLPDGEIWIAQSSSSPCGSGGGIVGCGGPQSTVFRGGQFYWSSGFVWLDPSLAGFGASVQQAVVDHEIGHTLGLGHFDALYQGQSQVMRSTVGAASQYMSGDANGVRYQWPWAAPANDNLASATVVTGDLTTNVNNAYASAEAGEPMIGGSTATHSEWFTYTAPRDGWFEVGTSRASPVPARLSLFSGQTLAGLTPLGADAGTSGSPDARVDVPVTSGTTYKIAVDTVGSTGSLTLQIHPPSAVPCDDVMTACNLSSFGARMAPVSTAGASAEVGEITHAGAAAGHSLWYLFNPTRTQPVTIEALSGAFVPSVDVMTGNTPTGLQAVSVARDPAMPRSRLTFNGVAGTTYRIAIDSGAAAGGLTLTLDPGFGGYTALTPVRVLDSRYGTGTAFGAARWPVGIDSPVNLWNRGGIPAAGVQAVVLNVTVTGATGPGYLSVFPYGSVRPTTSSLNYVAGQTVANLVSVKVGSGGRVGIFSSGGGPHVLADVVGWYGPMVGSQLASLAPTRALDSRFGLGAPGPWAAGQTRTLSLAGTHGVPVGATAVVMNVTAVSPTALGYVTVWPAGQARPTASNVNFRSGSIVANLVIAKLGPNGDVAIYNSAGTTQVVADVLGYFTASAAAVTSVTPTRLLDSRTGLGFLGPVAGSTSRSLAVRGVGPVPAVATAVLMNVTVVYPSRSGYLTVFPSGSAQPTASNLNFVALQTVPNLVLVPLGPDGAIRFFNSAGSADVLADVVAYVG